MGRRVSGWLLLGLVMAGCAGPTTSRHPAPSGLRQPPADLLRFRQRGLASWYGWPHHGRRTASGEIYDMNELTAAHRSLPFGTRVLVTNVENGRTVEVRINDRGPFVDGRIVDLSLAAARRLGVVGHGLVPVELRVLAPPPEPPADGR
jgi:rare lipoprotein A